MAQITSPLVLTCVFRRTSFTFSPLERHTAVRV